MTETLADRVSSFNIDPEASRLINDLWAAHQELFFALNDMVLVSGQMHPSIADDVIAYAEAILDKYRETTND